jgi:hypothetical protein
MPTKRERGTLEALKEHNRDDADRWKNGPDEDED